MWMHTTTHFCDGKQTKYFESTAFKGSKCSTKGQEEQNTSALQHWTGGHGLTLLNSCSLITKGVSKHWTGTGLVEWLFQCSRWSNYIYIHKIQDISHSFACAIPSAIELLSLHFSCGPCATNDNQVLSPHPCVTLWSLSLWLGRGG